MKKSHIAAAVGIALVGFVGYNQLSYSSNVKNGVDNLIYTINTTEYSDQNVSASLTAHQGGIFASSGVITFNAGTRRNPVEFELAYEIDHGPATFINGASYHAAFTNTLMDGQRDKTATSELMNGQPITVEGDLDNNSLTGLLTIPAIALAESGIELHSQPITAEFTLNDFNKLTTSVYQLQANIPAIKFTSPGEAMELLDAKLLINNNFDGEKGDTKVELNIADASVGVKGRHADYVGIKALSLTTDAEVNEQFTNNFTLAFDQFEDSTQTLSDAEFSYTLTGLDGQVIVDTFNITQVASQEGWSERRLQQAIEDIIKTRGDELLAHNPSLEINRITAKLNNELLIDGKGQIKLDASRLPSNFVTSLLNSTFTGDPKEIEKAIFASFDAELGKAAGEAAALLDPTTAALLTESGDTLSFTMEDGKTTLNGKRI